MHTPLATDIAVLLPRLRRFARAVACGSEEADELVQLAVAQALAGSAQWASDTRLDSGIFRIMKNIRIDDVRNRVRRERVGAPERGVEQTGAAEIGQQKMACQRAIGLLSEEQRVVIGLVLVDGMAYAEAAAVLEIPTGTLTSRLARAREALQGVLADQSRTAT